MAGIKIKARRIRILTALVVAAIVIVASACKLGWGTLCSLGPGGLAYICPLGFLEGLVASRIASPGIWLPLAIMLATIVLFGRYFCAWVCPTIFVKALGRSVPRRNRAPAARTLPAAAAPANPPPASALRRALAVLDSRHLVLASALLSAAIFGFPVFCMICPVGLFFGSAFAIGRLFSIQQPSLELVLYPAIIIVEIFVLKNWCRSFCPLGALLTLLSTLNPFFRPTVRPDRCLHSDGVNCQACRNACPEEIDLHQPLAGRALPNCTKCLACSEKCPSKAIHFPFRP